jgi:hypothetical protein
VHAIPDQFIEHSPQALQRKNFRLDPEGLAARVLEVSRRPSGSAGRDGESSPGSDEKLVETAFR